MSWLTTWLPFDAVSVQKWQKLFYTTKWTVYNQIAGHLTTRVNLWLSSWVLIFISGLCSRMQSLQLVLPQCIEAKQSIFSSNAPPTLHCLSSLVWMHNINKTANILGGTMFKSARWQVFLFYHPHKTIKQKHWQYCYTLTTQLRLQSSSNNHSICKSFKSNMKLRTQ